MKKLLLLLITWLLAGWVQAQGTDAHRAFVPAETLVKLQSLNEVYIGDIGAMLITPRLIPPLERHPRRSGFHKKLTEEDRRAFMDLLAKSSALAGPPGGETCRYQPGYRLDFVDPQGKVAATLLLCFNCDVWAAAGGDGLAEWNPRPTALGFGSAKDERTALLDLIQHYFTRRAPKSSTSD